MDDYTFRIYLSVNPKDVMGAYFNFDASTSDWVRQRHNGDEGAKRKFKRVDKNWISELQRPQNRAETFFQWDIDTEYEVVKENVESVVRDNAEVIAVRPSPNGFHVISETFNYTDTVLPDMEDVELRTDGNVFLEKFQGDEEL